MTQNTKKFIIDVAPIARLPLHKQQYFSYLSSQELKPGTLVTIPLFRREVPGIVLSSKPEFEHFGGYELKNVYRVVQENYLTAEQLKLANQISEYYLTSLGVVFKHFMPMRAQARNSSHQSSVISHHNPTIKLTLEQQLAVDEISKCHLEFAICNLKFLLRGPSSSGKTEVYIHAIKKIKEADKDAQFLVLLPELTLAPQALERYGAYFESNEIILLHSKMTKGQFYQNWQAVQDGSAKLIIATRAGVFAPFKKLGLIVIDEEQDMSYKQWDMNPRYDARKVAEFLSDNFNCPAVFGTSTPRIETFYKSQINEYKLIEIPKLVLSDTKYKIQNTKYELADMRKEKWTSFDGKKKANHSLLSTKLQGEISYALSHKLQVMLFVNHQGASTFSLCRNCKAVLKCPKCDRALVYDETGIYKCLHCKYDSGAFPTCGACNGIEFENIGIGTQSVAKEIKKLFPSARLARLDSSVIKKAGAQEEIYNNFMSGQIDILVGTQMITKGWDNPNVALVGIIDADSLFSFPDFLTDERAYSNIMQVSGRTGRYDSRYPGQVIIQTFNPNNKVFEFVTNNDYPSFFEKEIAQRAALKYPPLGKLIKLTFKDEAIEKIEKETQNVYKKISDLIAEHENIRISEPLSPMVSKIRGKFLKQMLIKTGSESEPLPQELIKLLSSLSSSWTIDVDPISIA